MANQAMNDAWEPLLERYLAHAARYYKAVGKPIKIPGATPGQLAFLQSQSQRYSLVIDPSIERVLARVNGAGYDGVFLYGIQIPEHGDLYGRIDMVYMNRLIEERGPDARGAPGRGGRVPGRTPWPPSSFGPRRARG